MKFSDDSMYTLVYTNGLRDDQTEQMVSFAKEEYDFKGTRNDINEILEFAKTRPGLFVYILIWDWDAIPKGMQDELRGLAFETMSFREKMAEKGIEI